MKKSMLITDVSVNRTKGTVNIITKPSDVNTSGAFTFTNEQFGNLAASLGLTPNGLIRVCKGGLLSFDAEFRKAGVAWEQKDKAGNVIAHGVYGEKNGNKDSWGLTRYSISLSPQAEFMRMQSAFAEPANSNPVFNFAPATSPTTESEQPKERPSLDKILEESAAEENTQA